MEADNRLVMYAGCFGILFYGAGCENETEADGIKQDKADHDKRRFGWG